MVALLASSASIDSTGTTHSHNMVADAFAIPKLRTRTPSSHSSIVATVFRSSKAPLEFAQCSGEERRSTSAVSTKSAPGGDNDDDDVDSKSDQTKRVARDPDDKESQVNNGREDKLPPPGSPLSMLCQDANEEDPFELHLGRALDALKSDYPKMLTKQPGEYHDGGT